MAVPIFYLALSLVLRCDFKSCLNTGLRAVFIFRHFGLCGEPKNHLRMLCKPKILMEILMELSRKETGDKIH